MNKLNTLYLSVISEFNDLQSDVCLSTQVWKRAVKVDRHNYISIDNIHITIEKCGAKHIDDLEILSAYINLQNVENKTIDFSGFDFSAIDKNIYAINILNCNNIILRNINLLILDSHGIYIGKSTNITIENSNICDLQGAGIVIGNDSQAISLKQINIRGLGGAGILIGEGSKSILIEDCVIEKGRGKSNWTAGIVLTDRCCTDFMSTPDSIFGPDGYWALQQPIFDREDIVGLCVVRNNIIRDNLSSGIYIDGTFDNVIIENKLYRNSKEGICFDYGATRNIFAFNTVEENGNRYGKTDDDLAKDFVLHHGRCADGTATAKVPGISIDNSILNCIQYNTIINNYGSGIKLVRTSFLNNIAFNICINNNLGDNFAHHFFGIEIGAAVPDEESSKELNFLPSGDNIICRNLISSSHYAGIFLDKGTVNNHIFDNSIFDSKKWSIEGIDKDEQNFTLNNLSFQDSRNITLSRCIVSMFGLGSKRL